MDPLQCPDVPGNAVVRIVTAEHLIEVVHLLLNWQTTISLASSCRRCVQEGTVCDVESGARERQQYAAKSMELHVEPVN